MYIFISMNIASAQCTADCKLKWRQSAKLK